MGGVVTEEATAVDLDRYEAVVGELRRKLQEMGDELANGLPESETPPGLYDFHSHTFLSDGVLSPIELIRRAIVNGYSALGIADHCGAGTMPRVIEEVTADAALARRHWNFPVYAGVELTHVPAASIADLAAEAKRLGAGHVVVHGESPVEPVEPGTNLAAVSCPDVDVLAHPGLLTEEEARIAAETGVFIEVTAKDGHSLGNGRVVGLARAAGADCLLNSDTHLPSHLLTVEFAERVARAAGVREAELGTILRANPEKLIARIEARR
jgi:histidinol phosphatase-like PHP family hydrolase